MEKNVQSCCKYYLTYMTIMTYLTKMPYLTFYLNNYTLSHVH